MSAEKYPIAHRDVKSANVLVRDEGGECVLGDLGLALILDPSADTKQLANAGQVRRVGGASFADFSGTLSS